MRVMALAGMFVLSAAAQTPPAPRPTGSSTNESTLTIKVDSQTPKPPTSYFVEYVSVAADLAKALAWPLVFGILIVSQRRQLRRLLEALTSLVQNSNHIKLFDMIDLEVSRSAKEAESRELPAEGDITPSEIEGAARVGRIAESTDLSGIRARMLEFAREYEATRSNMKPGAARTRAMNAIVARMRTLAIAAAPFLDEFAFDKTSSGKRLAAAAILQMSPDLKYLDWAVERIGTEQPFVFFHASLALLAMVRSFGANSKKALEAATKRALSAVLSFKGGVPDANTVRILQIAQAELGSFRDPP